MILKTLHLHNFRNFQNETVSFGPELNIIFGNNAQGKTNLLEAIYLLSTGRSFRSVHFHELIKHGENYFYIEAEIIKDLVAQTIKIYFDKDSKKIHHNSTLLPSLTSLLGIMPSVVHAPLDIDLISGFPALRRRFLNLHIAQYDPIYVHHLSRYSKALKQRNFLLKSRTEKDIEIWEIEMAKSAAYLTEKRAKTISLINYPLNEIMQILSLKKDKVHLQYLPSISLSSDMSASYLSHFEKSRKRDLALGVSTLGPHRDDFNCYIDDKQAKIFASEGQKRSFTTALRLSEHRLLCERILSPALLCIDDFGSHLDEKRQIELKSLIQNLNQVFITIPIKERIWDDRKTDFINVENGKVVDNVLPALSSS